MTRLTAAIKQSLCTGTGEKKRRGELFRLLLTDSYRIAGAAEKLFVNVDKRLRRKV
jgi:hypothetical protein